MDAAKKTWGAWLTANGDRVWDSVRIYLGFALVVKGFAYLMNLHSLASTMEQVQVPFAGSGLAQLVAVTHITGGLLMTFGLLTRLGALIQIPSVAGAALFVHLKEGLFTSGQTLEFSVLVLFLLSVIATVGAGRLSIDHYFSGKDAEKASHRETWLPSPAL